MAFERHGNKISDGFRPVGSQDIGVGLINLEHAPHALYVLLGKAPIPLGVEIS